MRPILFEPFGIALHSYGGMLLLSLVVGWVVTLRLADAEGLGRARMEWCFIWTGVWAIACARLLFVAANLPLCSNVRDVFDL